MALPRRVEDSQGRASEVLGPVPESWRGGLIRQVPTVCPDGPGG